MHDLTQDCSLKPVRPEVSKASAWLRYLSPNGKLLQSEEACNLNPFGLSFIAGLVTP
jgi:hypothetical protein